MHSRSVPWRTTSLGALLLVLSLGLMACDDDAISPRIPGAIHQVEGVGSNLVVGEEVTLAVRVTDLDGDEFSGVTVEWQVASGDGSVSPATSSTDAEGLARTTWTLGTTAGTQSVLASVEGLSPVTFQTSARPGPLSGVVADPNEVTITVLRDTAQLNASGVDEYGNPISDTEISWTSLDTTIASVTETGLVTALANGEVDIIASAGELVDTVSVTIDYAPLESIEVSAESDTIIVDSTLQLTAEAIDTKGNTYPADIFEWSSGDTTTATVDADGLVTSHAGGTVTISAEADGVVGEFILVVRGRVHRSDISADEVWTRRDSPHWVTKELWVNGATSPKLTIEAGAEVRFYPAASLKIGWSSQSGTLIAEGTDIEPIIFTSDAASPSPGDWDGIEINGAATNDTRLSHAILEYCGKGGKACLDVQSGAQIGVESVTIQESAGLGARLNGSAAFSRGSSDLSVHNTEGYAIEVGANQAGTIPVGGTFSGGESSIWIRSGDLTTTQTWPNLGIPYILSGSVTTINGRTSPTLTIPAGTELRFLSGGGIQVGWSQNSGTLKVLGTETEPVTMTSNSASPSAGAWRGIQFVGAATNENIIEHTTLSYCGGTGLDACLRVENAIVTVKDLTIEHSGAHGAFLSGSGGRFAEGSERLTVRDGVGYPLRITANRAGTIPLGGDYSENDLAAIFIVSGDLTQTQTWRKPGVPYLIGGGTIYIYGQTAPVLTLEPGLELRMSSDAQIRVGWSNNAGTLISAGTIGEPITFTANSDAPQPGYWDSIYFTGDAAVDSRISHTIIEYGKVNLHLRRVPGGLENLTIRGASECGVKFERVSSPPDLLDQARNNIFENNHSDICG